MVAYMSKVVCIRGIKIEILLLRVVKFGQI